MNIVRMTKTVLHSCSKDKVKHILHKFKLKLSKRMRSDLDITWRKIWDEERQTHGWAERQSTATEGFQVIQGLCSGGKSQGDFQDSKESQKNGPGKGEQLFCDKRESWKTPSGVFNFICLFHNKLSFLQVGVKDLVLGSRSNPDMKNKDVIALHSFFLHRSTVRTFSSAPLNCLVDMMQSNTGCICYFSPPIFKSLL